VFCVFKYVHCPAFKFRHWFKCWHLNSTGVNLHCWGRGHILKIWGESNDNFSLTVEDIDGVIPWVSSWKMQWNSLQSYTQIFFPSYSFGDSVCNIFWGLSHTLLIFFGLGLLYRMMHFVMMCWHVRSLVSASLFCSLGIQFLKFLNQKTIIQIFLAEEGFPKLNTVVIVVKMVVLLLQTLLFIAVLVICDWFW
jgi:hypothetical protein